MANKKKDIVKLFNAGVDAVSGCRSVVNAFKKHPDFKPDMIISVGKAATGMCRGALEMCGDVPAVVVTKYNHTETELANNNNVKIFEAAHPIPDKNSLKAGQLLIDTVANIPQTDKLLLLVSGGASAIAECLSDGITLGEFQKLTDVMMANGLNIGQINSKRKQVSKIKDGKLLSYFKGKEVLVLAISDVEGDDISTIGSGIGDIKRCRTGASYELVATNKIARLAVEEMATKLGYKVINNVETLYDDVTKLKVEIGNYLQTASKGVHIWGGEPTVILPKNPGEGGRNQALALLLAAKISGLSNVEILVAGTDGSDGPTSAAGGIVNGETFSDAVKGNKSLAQANSGAYLREHDSLFVTGPTGTNVMDLVIAIKD